MAEAGAAPAAEVVELTLLAREAGALEVPVLEAPVTPPGLEEVVAEVVLGWATTAFFTPTLPTTGFTPALLGPEVADGCRAGFISRNWGVATL